MEAASPETALQCLVAVARHHGIDLSIDRIKHDYLAPAGGGGSTVAFWPELRLMGFGRRHGRTDHVYRDRIFGRGLARYRCYPIGARARGAPQHASAGSSDPAVDGADSGR